MLVAVSVYFTTENKWCQLLLPAEILDCLQKQSCVGGNPTLMGRRRRGLSALYAHIWDSFLEREIISYFHRPWGEAERFAHIFDNVIMYALWVKEGGGGASRVLFGARGKVANTCDGILSTFPSPFSASQSIVRMFACFGMCVEGISLCVRHARTPARMIIRYLWVDKSFCCNVVVYLFNTM